MCWDLDNTLVNSGELIRGGSSLPRAVIDAEPVANMLEFFGEMHDRLPGAEHFVLSARRHSMRIATHGWLRRHGVVIEGNGVCLVPSAEAKVRIWEHLARDARLIIVDDLSYDHEFEQPRVYNALVDVARRTAAAYVGVDDILRIAANPAAIELVVIRVVTELLAASSSGA